MIQVGILAVPGCLNSAVYGVIEILAQADKMNGSPVFSHVLLSADGRPVQGYTGVPVVPEGGISGAAPDIIVLPPVLSGLEELLSMTEVIEWLTAYHAAGGLVATVCAGAFLLAETGVLDGRDATTHWNLAEIFHQRYPAVNLQIQRLIIDGGDYICTGGVSAWMDLALHLITRVAGRDLSRSCAKMLLMDPHREYQTPYGMGGFRRNHGDEAVLKAQLWLEENFAFPVRVSHMAEKAALGERTFLRRFRSATGESPVQYLQQVRVEAAQNLLESTSRGVEEVAEAVGYSDYSAFRKLFKRIMGCTPSAYRQRFGGLG